MNFKTKVKRIILTRVEDLQAQYAKEDDLMECIIIERKIQELLGLISLFSKI